MKRYTRNREYESNRTKTLTVIEILNLSVGIIINKKPLISNINMIILSYIFNYRRDIDG